MESASPSRAVPNPVVSMSEAAAGMRNDDRSLRDTLGAFDTGVVLVSADMDGRSVGLLANSFTSVSLDPPLLSLSLANSSRTLFDLRNATFWGLSVLGAHQTDDFAKLSRSADVRFQGVATEFAFGGSRLLSGAAAYFVVTREQEIAAGDHRLFLLRVIEHARKLPLSPLVFHNGAIGTLTTR